MHFGMAPDGAGGITGLGGPYGLIELKHVTADGTIDRTENVGTGITELSGTADGGFLMVSNVPLLGQTPSSSAMLMKVSADWTVQWSVPITTNWPQNLHVRGSRVDGGGLLHILNGGPGGTVDRLDWLARYDADGNVVWEQHAPNLTDFDLADNDDVVAFAYLTGVDSPFAPAPDGMAATGGVYRVGPDGTIRWTHTLGSAVGAALNGGGGALVSTPDGGAMISAGWYQPGGQSANLTTVSFGEQLSDIPTPGYGISGTAIVKLDDSGTATSIEWPTIRSPAEPPDGTRYVETKVYDMVPARDGESVYVAGVTLAYFILNVVSVVPYDGGITSVAGPTAGQSGSWLAKIGPEGRGDWALGHWVDDEFGYGRLATDGDHLFLDGFGNQLELGAPAGDGGNLLKLPLNEQ